MSTEFYPLTDQGQLRIIYRTMDDNEILIRERINDRLDNLGYSARRASELAGMNPDTLGKFLSGKTRSLKANNFSALAQTLQVDDSWLAGTSNTLEVTGTMDATLPSLRGPEPFGVKFGGIVEAGSWRVVDTMNQDGEFKRVPIAPDPRYPFEMQFSFLVAGDSMNKARIFEGMQVLAVDISEWEKHHHETIDGQIVVVECLRNGGHERERTIKRLRVFRDRVELQPESDNPQHETIVLHNGEDEKGRVVAVALTASWVLG
jgi:SOS-response transcriptional repressor LexA